MVEGEAYKAAEGDRALDCLIFLFKWKKVIAAISGSFILAVIIVVLVLPKKYQAETKILLPQVGQNLSVQLLSQLGGLNMAGGLAGNSRTSSELYVTLLKSRTVLDRIIDRFNLMKGSVDKGREAARMKLLKALSVQDQKKSGMLSIGVEDTDSKRSAEMSNAFVEELKDLSRSLAVTEASQRRLFFEEQMNATREVLVRAEEALKGYQEQTGAIEIKEQTKTVIESVANLRAQIAAKEVELKVLRSYATPQNPDVQKFQDQLRGMKEQLAKLEANEGGRQGSLMSTANLPRTGTGYVRKLRDLKYAETLYELLTKQFELARIDEAKDGMVIQVVEKAIPPEKAVKPKAAFFVLTISFFGFFMALVVAGLLEYGERVRQDPARQEQLTRLQSLTTWKRG